MKSSLKLWKSSMCWGLLVNCSLHMWDLEKQIVSSPSVKSLLICSAAVGRKLQSWPRGWGSVTETTTAAVALTEEGAEGRQRDDELRRRTGCAGGPTLLWLAPGNTGYSMNPRWQMFIIKSPRNQGRSPLGGFSGKSKSIDWWRTNEEHNPVTGDRDDRVMRGGRQTGDSEMKLRTAGQTLSEKSIQHHPLKPHPNPRHHHHLLLSLSDGLHQ